MVKHLNTFEISRKSPSKCKIYVCNFPGAKTRCMKDYLKPSLLENLDHFVLHVGTNYLNSERSSEPITKLIADLAASLKHENHDGSISNTIVSTNNQELRETAFRTFRDL